jgi:hypothetical protein
MRLSLQIRNKTDSGSRRIHFSASPLAILLLTAFLACLALFAHSAIKFTWDHYSPYEGTVVEIKRNWTDQVTSESGDVEHLIIRTPRGRLIDKSISFQTRITGNIREGDYVVKKRGFRSRVRRRDKDL